jgi:predicted RNA binding protein YcfA (HicA-like mRNA interferase family)
MDRLEKLLDRARRSRSGLSFPDFEALMKHAGWTFKRQKGSHRLWCSPSAYRLPVQPVRGKAKEYQVRQFLTQYDKEYRNG